MLQLGPRTFDCDIAVADLELQGGRTFTHLAAVAAADKLARELAGDPAGLHLANARRRFQLGIAAGEQL